MSRDRRHTPETVDRAKAFWLDRLGAAEQDTHYHLLEAEAIAYRTAATPAPEADYLRDLGEDASDMWNENRDATLADLLRRAYDLYLLGHYDQADLQPIMWEIIAGYRALIQQDACRGVLADLGYPTP